MFFVVSKTQKHFSERINDLDSRVEKKEKSFLPMLGAKFNIEVIGSNHGQGTSQAAPERPVDLDHPAGQGSTQGGPGCHSGPR